MTSVREASAQVKTREQRLGRAESRQKVRKMSGFPVGDMYLILFRDLFFKKKSIAKSGLLRKSVKRNGLGCQSSKDWPWMQCVLMPALV